MKVARTVWRRGKDGDYFKVLPIPIILLAVANLFEYLNTKYGEDEKLNEEVRSITKTLYDPAVEQRGIEKGVEIGIEKIVINMFKKGKSVEDIIEVIELPYEKVVELKSKYKN